MFGETVHTLEGIPRAVVADKTRFVIEKPFGRDTASCQALLDGFQGLGEEMQFRLDHYLAVRQRLVFVKSAIIYSINWQQVQSLTCACCVIPNSTETHGGKHRDASHGEPVA